MDEIVKAALKKWPQVPHCYGWLALDARGDWYMRDDRIQAAGPFPLVKGSRILHDKLREFIHRNYDHDEQGCWFFQNGPQRVYVELEAAPWIWRLHANGKGVPRIESHTGLDAKYRQACLDEQDRLFVATDRGLGLVHTLDMELAADAVGSGAWTIERKAFDVLRQEQGFVLSPANERTQAQAGGPGRAEPA